MATTKKKTADPDRAAAGYWVPPIFAVALYCVPLLVPALPWAVGPALGVAIALFGSMAAAGAFPAAVYGDDFRFSLQLCTLAGGVFAAGWLGAAQANGGPVLGQMYGAPLWQWLLGGLLVIGGWWTALMLRAASYAAAMDVRRDGPPTATEVLATRDAKCAQWAGIIDRAGVTGIEVTGVDMSSNESTEVVYLRSLPAAPGRKAAKYETLTASIGDVVNEVSRTFERERGIGTIDDEDVVPARGRNRHTFQLVVTLRREIGRQIPYPRRAEPCSQFEPVNFGLYKTDDIIRMTQFHEEEGSTHTTALAMTGAGKGNLLNVLMAELTGSNAREVWAGTSHKLHQLVYKWLIPWIEGKTDRPVLDRVAGESQIEILKMLEDALHFMVLSNAQLGRLPVRPSGPGKSTLTVILDESSGVLENPRKHTLWDGRSMNASEMWSELKQLARTAQLSCVDASQFALFNAGGSAGNKQKRNTGAGICGKLRRTQDAGAVMPGMPAHVNVTRIPKHEFFFQPDSPADESAALPGRPYAMYREEHIVPVAIAHTPWRTGLDPAITSQLRHYAGRWSADRQPDLVETARQEGHTWPGSAPVQPAAEQPAVTTSSVPPLPAPQEQPVTKPAQPADDWAQALPSGWQEDGFDVWAAFTGTPAEDAAPKPGGVLAGLPDTSRLRAAVARMNAGLARQAGAGVADPLGAVLRALAHPGAPQEWVSTEQLAGVLGRFDQDADPAEKRRATEALGLELARQIGLKSEELPRGVNPRRPKGWRVEVLREAARRLADGGSA